VDGNQETPTQIESQSDADELRGLPASSGSSFAAVGKAISVSLPYISLS
jgi:hypothetical protein